MITIINGRRTQGKTTLAYCISLRKPTRVIFDPRKAFRTTNKIISDPGLLYELMETEPEVIVQPESNVQGMFQQTAQEFREWTLDNPQEPVCFLVDESRFIDTPNMFYEPFDQTLRFSESELIDVVMTSHRPSDIDVNIRAIADYLVFFRTTQEHDLKVIVQRCGEGVGEIVNNLPDKHFLLWDDGVAIYRVESNPEKWYVDIKQFNASNKVEE